MMKFFKRFWYLFVAVVLFVVLWMRYLKFNGKAIYVAGNPEISLVKWFTRHPIANEMAKAKLGISSADQIAVTESEYNAFAVGSVLN